MKAVLATIIIIHNAPYQTFAGVLYQGMIRDTGTSESIIIDPENKI
jgi:hypothetical protein